MPQSINWRRARRLRAPSTTLQQHRAEKAADRFLREADARAPKPSKKTKRPRPSAADRITKAIPNSNRDRRRPWWPITISAGPHPLFEGALDIIRLDSRKHADQLGYAWVGRR